MEETGEGDSPGSSDQAILKDVRMREQGSIDEADSGMVWAYVSISHFGGVVS
jgi:hypothetical protein